MADERLDALQAAGVPRRLVARLKDSDANAILQGIVKYDPKRHKPKPIMAMLNVDLSRVR